MTKCLWCEAKTKARDFCSYHCEREYLEYKAMEERQRSEKAEEKQLQLPLFEN